MIKFWCFTLISYFHLHRSLNASPPTKLARCSYDIELLWSKEVGHAPFAGIPLIADVDADGHLDVVAAPFTDVLTVLSGQDGHVLPSTHWPKHLVDMSIHASPLLYDVDKDGLEDIMIVTSDGELLFYKYDGNPHYITAKLAKVLLDESWDEKWISYEQTPVQSFIQELPKNRAKSQVPAGFVAVDPHVLATPVIADLNGDNIVEEMVIPVSYYFSHERYNHDASLVAANLTQSDLERYLVGSVTIFNLTSLKPIHTVHLELTKASAEYPGYVLSTPTVIDLDSNGSAPEIVVSTAAGRLHVLTSDGTPFVGYPQYKGPLQGQVLVADLIGDGFLDMVMMNSSGVIMKLNTHGQLQWTSRVSGTTTSGFRLADINGDGTLEIIMGTDDGNVYALDGKNGSHLLDWPYRVTKELTGLPLITRLDKHHHLDVVIMSDNHHLHIIRGDTKCRHAYKVGEMTYVSPISHDLVPMAPGLEILVATRDGTVLCLGRKPRLDLQRSLQYIALEGMSGEYRTYNGFTYQDAQSGIYILREAEIMDVTGSWMTLNFEIIDFPEQQLSIAKSYRVNVYLGSSLQSSGVYTEPGTYSLEVATPDSPSKAHLKVILTNRHGQVFQDRVAVRFNMLFLHDLPWMLLCPFVAMAIILLFLHGYPAADLLPMTRSKNI